MRRSDNTSARCTKSKTRSAAAKGLAQVRSRLRRCQTNRANRRQRDTDQPLCCFDAQGPLHRPLPIGFTHERPPKHHWGSERHHSTRTPRGTFDGETVVAQKPALGTAKTAGQGWSAGGLCACHVDERRTSPHSWANPESRQRAVITFQRRPLPAIRAAVATCAL